jgi:hypothetical protein
VFDSSGGTAISQVAGNEVRALWEFPESWIVIGPTVAPSCTSENRELMEMQSFRDANLETFTLHRNKALVIRENHLQMTLVWVS